MNSVIRLVTGRHLPPMSPGSRAPTGSNLKAMRTMRNIIMGVGIAYVIMVLAIVGVINLRWILRKDDTPVERGWIDED